MAEKIACDVCVIGGGSGGLTVAAGASQLGAKVVLIEGGEMGGDCLNVGCVPSKALIAAAKAAHAGKAAAPFGVTYDPPRIDFPAVMDHVKGVIASIAPVDSQERFEGLGVTVLRDWARFLNETTVAAAGKEITAKRIVVATGSRPLVPPVPGLDEVPFLTNETLFDLREQPEHLIVMGGGPIGCELAQSFARLGSKVTLVEMASILPKDDPELVAVVRASLQADGVELREGAKAVAAAREGEGVSLTVESGETRETIAGSHLLVAAGRKTTTDGLDLEKGGIAYDRRGISVDKSQRSTSNKRVYAVGDVGGNPQFTHMAGYGGGLFIREFLFRLPGKVNLAAFPWVTYSDPELAHVGMTEAMARDKGEGYEVLRWSFDENDRAQAERATDGLVKAIVTPKGEILGCSIAGPHAGELIQPWILAIHTGQKIGKLATMIAPYPTFGEVSKRAAGSYYTPKLFSARTKALVRFLLKFG
ncbi:dihydrolipoyl dehydrogenase family protein [Limibacillus halophilus]|jgi:pyruvate/2-oxoglutarate dehydrogenase complex dihydrolipoamide dehydrogenase (E3) component